MIENIARTIFFLVLTWLALAVLIFAPSWAPEDALLQSARFMALAVAALVLIVSALGAVIGLLGVFWARPVDPAPRP